MALIEVEIPEDGVNVFGIEYAGGVVAVGAARAKVLVEAGASVVHDVLGELSGVTVDADASTSSNGDIEDTETGTGSNGALTTEDLQPGGDDAPGDAGAEEDEETAEVSFDGLDQLDVEDEDAVDAYAVAHDVIFPEGVDTVEAKVEHLLELAGDDATGEPPVEDAV